MEMRNVESLKVQYLHLCYRGGTESKVIYELNCPSALQLHEEYFQQIPQNL